MMQNPTTRPPGQHTLNVISSPAYRRMMGMVKLAWMASHAHHCDEGLPNHPPTPALPGSNESLEARQELFRELLSYTTSANARILRPEQCPKEHVPNQLYIQVRSHDGASDFAVQLSRGAEFSPEDASAARAMASQFALTDPNNTAALAPQSSQEFLKSHNYYLFALSQAGMEFLEEVLPFKKTHVARVAASMQLPATSLSNEEGNRPWGLSKENIDLITYTALCHDLGGAMTAWMALEGQEPELKSMRLHAATIFQGPQEEAVRQHASAIFGISPQDPAIGDMIAQLGAGEISASPEISQLFNEIEAGRVPGIKNWDDYELPRRVTDASLDVVLGTESRSSDSLKLYDEIRQGNVAGFADIQDLKLKVRHWHVEQIEIATRSPVLVGLRAAALHHLDFADPAMRAERGEEDKSSPPYIRHYRDNVMSFADASLPIMDKLDAGFSNKLRRNPMPTPEQKSAAFAEALNDLIHAHITNGNTKENNAAVHPGLLRHFYEHGVFDEVARNVYQTELTPTHKSNLEASFDDQGIAAISGRELQTMMGEDQRTDRWVNRIGMQTQSQPMVGAAR